MSSLNFTYGIHTISWEGVYEDVLKLYVSSDVLRHYPVIMHFNGEMALDGGGIKRDVFAAFFEEMYCHLFEGSSLVIPFNSSWCQPGHRSCHWCYHISCLPYFCYITCSCGFSLPCFYFVQQLQRS